MKPKTKNKSVFKEVVYTIFHPISSFKRKQIQSQQVNAVHTLQTDVAALEKALAPPKPQPKPTPQPQGSSGLGGIIAPFIGAFAVGAIGVSFIGSINKSINQAFNETIVNTSGDNTLQVTNSIFASTISFIPILFAIAISIAAINLFYRALRNAGLF